MDCGDTEYGLRECDELLPVLVLVSNLNQPTDQREVTAHSNTSEPRFGWARYFPAFSGRVFRRKLQTPATISTGAEDINFTCLESLIKLLMMVYNDKVTFCL